MKLIAITGSIGCGKTTIAGLIRSLVYAVYDVDGWVRRLYYKKSFIRVIDSHFPGVVENGAVNKRKLRNLVFNNNTELIRLEGLIHPFLKQNLRRVIRQNASYNELIFLDVALLFEMGWDIYCDCIIVANVDYETQKMRVMKRDGITGEDFDKINDIQMSNRDKIALADVFIDTGRPQNQVFTDLISIIDGLEC